MWSTPAQLCIQFQGKIITIILINDLFSSIDRAVSVSFPPYDCNLSLLPLRFIFILFSRLLSDWTWRYIRCLLFHKEFAVVSLAGVYLLDAFYVVKVNELRNKLSCFLLPSHLRLISSRHKCFTHVSRVWILVVSVCNNYFLHGPCNVPCLKEW